MKNNKIAAGVILITAALVLSGLISKNFLQANILGVKNGTTSPSTKVTKVLTAEPAPKTFKVTANELTLFPLIQGKTTTVTLANAPSNLQKVAFYSSTTGSTKETLIGSANKPSSDAGVCDALPSDVWRLDWVAPQKNSVTISAYGFVDKKKIKLASGIFSFEPHVAIAGPQFNQCVKNSVVTVSAYAPKDDAVTFTIQRAVEYSNEFGDGGGTAAEAMGTTQSQQKVLLPGKGLSPLNQHDVGDDLTDDQGHEDGNLNDKGDGSCAPTAVASSILWFKEHGYPQIVDDKADPTAKDLVNDLGNRAGTGQPDKKKNGTKPGNMQKAIEQYLKDHGLSDEFHVELLSATLENIVEQFKLGQDVTLFYLHDKYHIQDEKGKHLLGHAVEVNDVGEPDKNGARKVQIMNPRNGKNEEITINPDGTISGGDEGATLVNGLILAVSPNKKGDTLPLTGRKYANGKVSGKIDLASFAPGNYLLEVSASDQSNTYTDYQSINIGACSTTTTTGG